MATGWNICNSWAAVAGTLAISIASGGSVSLLYGIVVIFVLGGACALTMAELAAVYPTSGGQYHWTSILAPERASRGLVRRLRGIPGSVFCMEALKRARLFC